MGSYVSAGLSPAVNKPFLFSSAEDPALPDKLYFSYLKVLFFSTSTRALKVHKPVGWGAQVTWSLDSIQLLLALIANFFLVLSACSVLNCCMDASACSANHFRIATYHGLFYGAACIFAWWCCLMGTGARQMQKVQSLS